MIDLFTRFNKSKLNIETLSVFGRSEKFYAPGALLYVENGKGIIFLSMIGLLYGGLTVLLLRAIMEM